MSTDPDLSDADPTGQDLSALDPNGRDLTGPLARECEYITYFPVNIRPLTPADLTARPTDGSAGFGIYLHVPLCDQICPFCNYNKFLGGTRPDRLGGLLEQEIALYGNVVAPHIDRADFVYFGGGTPSVLSAARIGSLLARLRERFDLTAAEVCLECHPSHATPEYLSALREAGVNRISFGVQSFDARMLTAIGSHHTAEDSAACVPAARRAGFDNVAVDLMFLLPGQDMDSWSADLDRAVRTGADHISTYRMLLDPMGPLGRGIRLGRTVPQAGEATEVRMAQTALDTLAAAGYRHYGSCSSAGFDLCLPGRESVYELRHRAAPQCEYAAIGPGAVGFLNGSVYWNIHTLGEYARTVGGGALPVLAGRRLTDSDRRSRYAVLGVKHIELPLAPFRERFGRTLREAFPDTLDLLAASGLTEESEDVLRITPRGVHYMDTISKAFFNADNHRLPQPYKPELQMMSVDLHGSPA
ncbi:coproporphyrinogen-III oxidase family protein [Streptomyces sp. NPDC059479]|uniref:coproporphyrinogen-III oxidase family protein n=1 Tax=Streptomyces sp. NPDC059479 TaxID=3346848 RepID=UPI00367E4CC1